MLIQNQVRKIEQLKKTFTDDYKAKMKSVCINFLTQFGTKDIINNIAKSLIENENQECFLTCEFSDVSCDIIFKREIDFLLESINISHTSAYCKIMTHLIDCVEDWAENNYEGMMRKHKSKIMAASIYIQAKRKDFDHKLIRKTIREICSEARRYLKKNCKNDTNSIEEENQSESDKSNSSKGTRVENDDSDYEEI
ncbi:unnamed protein product [Brachionus calyciflorus]|uniref:Uncharacterized protein n=1 Tax=Brachionus calyciflorus TaxID=104777 RepID=A0A814PHM5_9BILA|nr:unnamed protein product [Brachionus calyciflorus]